MINNALRILAGFLGLLLCSNAARSGTEYPLFRSDLAAGATYSIDARGLHPTQFSLGLREVAAKTAVIDAKDAVSLETYLKNKDVPVVIGPRGVAYMTDGHHTLRALIESRQSKTAYGHVLANWSELDEPTFWARMKELNYVYLKDAAGRPSAPDLLPETLGKMQHDPWRGLAWAVMAAGGFEERKGWFFQEFAWADYFRGRVSWDDRDDAAFARAVVVAVELARSPAAAGLPGWKAAEPM